MTIRAKRLFKGNLGASIVTAYRVPVTTTAIIKNIIITNKTTTEAALTITISGIEIIYNYIVTPKDTITLDLSAVMNSTEEIILSTNMANSINIYISGVEVSN